MHRRTVLQVPRQELEDAQGIPEWAGGCSGHEGAQTEGRIDDHCWHLAIACAQTLVTGRPHAMHSCAAACDGLSDLWPEMIRPARRRHHERCPLRVGLVQVTESVQASAELGMG